MAKTAKERAVLHNNIALVIQASGDVSTFKKGIYHATLAIQENVASFPYPYRLLAFFKLSMTPISDVSQVVEELKRDWGIGKKTVRAAINEIANDTLRDECRRISQSTT